MVACSWCLPHTASQHWTFPFATVDSTATDSARQVCGLLRLLLALDQVAPEHEYSHHALHSYSTVTRNRQLLLRLHTTRLKNGRDLQIAIPYFIVDTQPRMSVK